MGKLKLKVLDENMMVRWSIEIIRVGEQFGVKEVNDERTLFNYQFGTHYESISELGNTQGQALDNFLKVEQALIESL